MSMNLALILTVLTLISGIVGQLTDKFEKAQFIRIVKAIEILIVNQQHMSAIRAHVQKLINTKFTAASQTAID